MGDLAGETDVDLGRFTDLCSSLEEMGGRKRRSKMIAASLQQLDNTIPYLFAS